MKDCDAPDQLRWIAGDLPSLSTVSDGAFLLAWLISTNVGPAEGTFRRVIMVMPASNELNPRRWCDTSYYPIGFGERVAYYAWLRRGP